MTFGTMAGEYAVYAELPDRSRYPCLQLDSYSLACGYCEELMYRNLPSACPACGARLVAEEVRMSESTTDEEYIYKLELLKRNIEEQRARNAEFLKYQSIESMRKTFDSAAEQERVRRAIELKSMAGSPYAAEGALWDGRGDPLEPVQNVSPWQQELANFMQVQGLKADLSKPEVQEIISPCMQQDRKILI